MGAVRGCDIPDDLSYNVENNVWAKQDGDTVTVGMTSYAAALAGQIVSYTPKKVGKSVKKDKSCATVESGKWVGPAKSPIAGEVLEINDAVSSKPSLINDDPYGEGWLVKIKADDWAGDSAGLVSGGDAASAFESKMDADGFDGCS
jgi:glycine cleavage system H protein